MRKLLVSTITCAIMICIVSSAGRASATSAMTVMPSSLFRLGPDSSPEDAADRREKLQNSATLRIAFSTMSLLNLGDEDLDYYYDCSFGLFLDYFYLRLRTDHGNGLDLYCRLSYRLFWTSDDMVEDETDLIYQENHMNLLSLDPGVRFIYGAYFFGQYWQLYLLVAPRVTWYYLVQSESRYGDDDTSHHLGSIGIIGGAGIEMTLTKDLGLFVEYNMGYSPLGENDRNIEGHQIYFGLTWRTSTGR